MATNEIKAQTLFTPEEIGVIGAQHIRHRRENKHLSVPLGVKSVDTVDAKGNQLLPLFSGEVMSIIGRPGNGKSGVMTFSARTRAEQLLSLKLFDRVVLYVTVEQMVEEMYAFNLAADRRISITNMARGEITDAEWAECLKHSIERRNLPLWYSGYSAYINGTQNTINIETITRDVKTIRDVHHKQIDIIFIDYLQLLPYAGNAESKTVGISNNLDMIKRLALQVWKCPVVLGVQAKREVDDYPDEMPRQEDGQWTSNIEQASDKILSVVRPRKYRKEGQEFYGQTVQGNNQLVLSVLKQKLGAANYVKWLYFDPIYNKLDDLEIEKTQ